MEQSGRMHGKGDLDKQDKKETAAHGHEASDAQMKNFHERTRYFTLFESRPSMRLRFGAREKPTEVAVFILMFSCLPLADLGPFTCWRLPAMADPCGATSPSSFPRLLELQLDVNSTIGRSEEVTSEHPLSN